MQRSSVLGSEMKLLESQLDLNDKSLEAMTAPLQSSKFMLFIQPLSLLIIFLRHMRHIGNQPPRDYISSSKSWSAIKQKNRKDQRLCKRLCGLIIRMNLRFGLPRLLCFWLAFSHNPVQVWAGQPPRLDGLLKKFRKAADRTLHRRARVTCLRYRPNHNRNFYLGPSFGRKPDGIVAFRRS